MTNITQALSENIVGTSIEAIPDEILLTAKACLLDTLGVALVGANEPLVQILRQTHACFGGAPQATLIGSTVRVPLPDAALINGAAAHALDFDDMHIESAMHPSAPVVASALAVADIEGASGQALLRAIALGIEAEIRIGQAVNPDHYRRGWHATGTLGHFGAAVAAGVLMVLDYQQMVNTLGIAGTQASGLKETFGSMSKPLHAGNAARNGVLAAALARRGFTSASDILGGDYGFGRVFSDSADWTTVLDGWGTQWNMSRILYKPHASSFCTQALIECALALRRRLGQSITSIRRIEGEVSAMSMNNARVHHPDTGLEAKFSLPHAIAQGLLHGQATPENFTDERARDPQASVLRTITTITEGEGFGWPEARVTLTLDDGRQACEHIDMQQRSASAAEKWAICSDKFLRLADSLPDVKHPHAVLRCISSLDTAQMGSHAIWSAIHRT
jgi:2-methylcitrate dehydratase PrpD